VYSIPNPLLPGCFIVNPGPILIVYITFLVTEIVTMALALSGLYRYRQILGGSSSLWNTLYHHGLLWLFMAILVDVPVIVSV
jgi:hypothetical protein